MALKAPTGPSFGRTYKKLGWYYVVFFWFSSHLLICWGFDRNVACSVLYGVPFSNICSLLMLICKGRWRSPPVATGLWWPHPYHYWTMTAVGDRLPSLLTFDGYWWFPSTAADLWQPLANFSRSHWYVTAVGDLLPSLMTCDECWQSFPATIDLWRPLVTPLAATDLWQPLIISPYHYWPVTAAGDLLPRLYWSMTSVAGKFSRPLAICW